MRDTVGDAAAVHGGLCFIKADWALIGSAFTTRGVEVLWPTKLKTDGPLSVEGVESVYRMLAAALPPS